MGWTVQYQGGKFTDRGYAMLKEGMRLTPFDIFVAQGGFNVGGVSASAGTHDREAWDISGSLLTPAERTTVETNYRRVGCAAWVRTPAQGFSSYHVHVVPIGGDLAPLAAQQVTSYKNGRNGLASNGPDTGTRAYVDMTWEKYTGSSAYRPPINTGGGSSGTTTEKDWFDMATQADLKQAFTDSIRGEGVSGAGDRAHNGVGENTQAVHELEKTLGGGQSSLLAEQRKTNDLLAQLIAKLGA